MANNHYKRVVLKLSGEALREKGARENISPKIVQELAKQIVEVKKLEIELAIVIGGGNIWRGQRSSTASP
jgi:uridylate kinase